MDKTPQPPSLLEIFENLEEPTKQLLADVRSPLLLGLAILILAESKAQRQYMRTQRS